MKYFIAFFKRQREFFNLAQWITFFLISPYIYRWFDKSAAPIDLGALSAVILAGIAIMIFKSLTWLLIRSIWPVMAEYSKNHFDATFKSITPWQKVKTYLLFYCFWAALMVAALRAFL